MKCKQTFTPPHKKLLLAGIMAIFLCGCSSPGYSNQSQAQPENSMQVTESTTSDINLKTESFDSESSFWECASEKYSTEFQDVRDGNIKFQYAVVDGIIANCSSTGDGKVKIVVGYQMGDESYQFFEDSINVENSDIRYGKELLNTLVTNDTVRVCVWVVNSDFLDYGNLVAIQKTGHIDNFVQNYISESESKTKHDQLSDSADSRLKNASVFTADVYNGSSTEAIGQRAYIILTKSDLQEITAEGYSQFVSSVVKDSGYNWFSIICDDGTGINFAGSSSAFATYGKLDNEGGIIEPIGYITLTENGYTYENAK